MDNQFDDAKFSAALLAFSNESAAYCEGISDVAAHDYAIAYARMLQDRARGIEVPNPRFPYGLFEPNRNLVQTVLENIANKYFAIDESRDVIAKNHKRAG